MSNEEEIKKLIAKLESEEDVQFIMDKTRVKMGDVCIEHFWETVSDKFLQALQNKDDEWRGKIGLLRQYLNERTSKELITNEELETFLLK